VRRTSEDGSGIGRTESEASSHHVGPTEDDTVRKAIVSGSPNARSDAPTV
jgi:hypothetical protein